MSNDPMAAASDVASSITSPSGSTRILGVKYHEVTPQKSKWNELAVISGDTR
jgi:hypothetical protein